MVQWLFEKNCFFDKKKSENEAGELLVTFPEGGIEKDFCGIWDV